MSNAIILIGMPGSGKSTIGVMLAKQLALSFIDTDIIIQQKHNCPLQDIIDSEGHIRLRQIEEQVLLELHTSNSVIATGGSVVYSEKGMQRLQQLGKIIFLDVELDELKQRIHNYETRGIAKRPNQSFQDLFKERQVLYQHYANARVNCNGLSMSAVLDAVVKMLA